MSVRAEDRNNDTGTLSTEPMKARKLPAAMPGAISGSVTRRKVVTGPAPRLREHSSSAGSSWVNDAPTVRSTKGARMTAWPTMISSIEGRKPISVKYISAANPKARPGSTSGDMNSASAARASFPRAPARPNAAAVPKTEAASAAQIATSIVLPAARWIWRERTLSNSCSYQRKERPCGGKRIERLSVSEVSSTITTGPIRISSASPARPPMTSV